MKRLFGKNGVIALAGMAALMVAACGDVQKEVCTKGSIRTFKQGQGFEIIDLKSKKVWGTADWTIDAFSSFDFPLSWILWRKNDPRQGDADAAVFLRSPGCPMGHYSYMTAFGRKFLHVVDLNDLRADVGAADDLIRATELTKHHQLRFEAGKQLHVLSDPNGVRYLLVARTASPATDKPDLPAGWTIHHGVLKKPFDYALDGTVKVLRLNNEDSYQGPLPAALVLPFESQALALPPA